MIKYNLNMARITFCSAENDRTHFMQMIPNTFNLPIQHAF